MTRRPITPVATYLKAWAALIALVLAMIGLAYLPLGSYSAPAIYLVGGVAAALVMAYFMHLQRSSPLTVIFAIAGFFWLAFLFVLVLSDFLTRTQVAPPW